MRGQKNTDGGIVSGLLVFHELFELTEDNRNVRSIPNGLEEIDASRFLITPEGSQLLLRLSPFKLEWDAKNTLYFESQTQWIEVPFDTNEEWQRFWEKLWFGPVFELTHPDFPNCVFQAYVHESPDWHGSGSHE